MYPVIIDKCGMYVCTHVDLYVLVCMASVHISIHHDGYYHIV